MKKIILLFLVVVCGCRSLPADTFEFDTIHKQRDYNYTIGETSTSWQLRLELKETMKTSGKNIGKIVISDKELTSGSGDNALWLPPSMLTFGIINLTGWPAYHESLTVLVEAKVYNTSGVLIDTFSAKASDWSVAACYYGFSPSGAHNRAYSGAYKKALDKVLSQIKNDDDLYNVLKKSADRAIAEQRKRDAEAKARAKKIEEQKKKHLNSVLSDLENL